MPGALNDNLVEPDAQPDPDLLIEFSAVTLRRGGATLVGPIDWSVELDERWVVLGPNGAGKTSLLRMAAAVEHPSSGTAFVLGERLGRTDMSELRSRIGLSSSALSQRIPDDEVVRDLVVSAGYAVLGRWREAADAYRKAALADPANAGYRQALEAALSRLEPPPAALRMADEPPPRVLLQSAPTVPALTVVSVAESVRAAPPETAAHAAPAVAAVPAAAARVEIVNGHGVRGAASRLRDALGTGPGTRLVNRSPYREPSTVIEYRPGYAAQARALARRMPISTQLLAAATFGSRADVRVVLGHDLNAF